MSLSLLLFIVIHVLSLTLLLVIIFEYRRVLRARSQMFDLFEHHGKIRHSIIRRVALIAYLVSYAVLLVGSLSAFFIFFSSAP